MSDRQGLIKERQKETLVFPTHVSEVESSGKKLPVNTPKLTQTCNINQGETHIQHSGERGTSRLLYALDKAGRVARRTPGGAISCKRGK